MFRVTTCFSLSEFSVGTEVIIFGDFNLPSLDWSSENAVHSYVPNCELLFFFIASAW